MPAEVSASRPMNASPFPGRFFAWASAGFSAEAGISNRATIASPATTTTNGRRTTIPAHLCQKPTSPGSAETIRFGITRRLSIRRPSFRSITGSSVIEARTETAGISIPPIPIERMNGSGRITMLRRPIATVEPETTTERPAWVIVSTTAVSTSLPWWISSRKRKIISRA